MTTYGEEKARVKYESNKRFKLQRKSGINWSKKQIMNMVERKNKKILKLAVSKATRKIKELERQRETKRRFLKANIVEEQGLNLSARYVCNNNCYF